MEKWGQISFYLIIGVLLVVVLSVFYSRPQKMIVSQPASMNDADTSAIALSIQSCLDYAVEDAATKIGMYGGYTIPTTYPDVLNIDQLHIPYYFYERYNFVPDDDFVMETQFDEQVYDSLFYCDLSEYQKQGFTLEFSDPRVSSTLYPGRILTDLDWEIKATKDDVTKSLRSQYTVTTPIRLYEILRISRGIVSQLEEDSSFLDMDYLNSYRRLGFDITVVSIQNNGFSDLLYMISDKNAQLGNTPFRFNFAVRP